MAKRYFEYIDDKSSKFWELSVTGKKITVRYGKIGTDGQTTLKEMNAPAEAKAQAEKLALEKIKKGYVEGGVSGHTSTTQKKLTPAKKVTARNKKILGTLKFTISSGGGDGAFLCIEKVTKELHDYFKKNDLDLEEYALDRDYADTKEIPENMRPFEPGSRAEFGTYKSGMTATDYLQLTVENEESDEVFSGVIPKFNIKKDNKTSDSLNGIEKGVYIVGYEGLEDCYISGQIDVDSEFDIKKLKVNFGHIDYEVGDREMISSITYDKQEVDWGIDSYEGTGDTNFGFVIVK